MLVHEIVRNNVVHLVAEQIRDGENERWVFKKKP